MGHQVTIANAEGVALAEELAAVTGESVEAAVTEAVRRRLDAERRLQSRLGRVLALAAGVRATMPTPLPSTGLHELYDENGLPR